MMVASPFIVCFLVFVALARIACADSDMQEAWAKENLELLNDLAWWHVSSDASRHLTSESYPNATAAMPNDGAGVNVNDEQSFTKPMLRRTLDNGNSTAGATACERAPAKSQDNIQVSDS